MNHYTQYFNYHVDLLRQFKALVEDDPLFAPSVVDIDPEQRQSNQQLLKTLTELSQAEHYTESFNDRGQWLIGRVILAFPQFTPHLPRDLLWFFGGDCLHFMPDEEINFYQALDELRFAAEANGQSFNYPEAKKQLQTLQ